MSRFASMDPFRLLIGGMGTILVMQTGVLLLLLERADTTLDLVFWLIHIFLMLMAAGMLYAARKAKEAQSE